MSGVGVANLPKTFSPAFTIMGGSRPVRHLTTRYMNSSGPGNDESSITSIHLEAMKEIIEDVANGGREDSGYVIMDVRGHDEIAQTGKLDDVVHTLPLPFIVEGAFSRDDDEFEEQFGFVKPSLDETLVFTCKAGVRAASAAELAQKAGYTDILAYAGGSNEWFS
jgi:rhodanese-related sulfurtransferase